MAFYQCFKTESRNVYCSSTKFRSHAEGAAWVTNCMANFGIQAADLLGKPYEQNSQPSKAIIWP